MPQRPLPPECLLEIVRILSREYDKDTMARLLCVNTMLCAITLPLLYGGCFHRNLDKYHYSNENAYHSTLQLIRTLLRQVHPQGRISGLLRAAYLPQDHQVDLHPTAEPPLFKYGHFVRRFFLHEKYEDRIFDIIGESVKGYAATHQVYEKHIAEEPFSTLRHELAHEGPEILLRMDLRQQLVWALCQDHLEVTEAINISLFDIERYMDHVHRFTSLSMVRFTAPEVLKDGWNDEGIEERDQWLDRHIRTMMDFIRRHTALHPSVLQKVQLPRIYRPNVYSPDDTQFEILSLLPPLQNPKAIFCTDWCKLVARLSDTNLSDLEYIDVGTNSEFEEEKLHKILKDQPPFLPRCRRLRDLKMDTLGPDMFRWAVLEKKQRDAGHQQASAGRHLGSREHGYHDSLVPLRSVRIRNNGPPVLVQELNDIAFAFSDSLEELAVSDWSYERLRLTDLTNAPHVVHGKDWDLPRLRTLTLEVHYVLLNFNRDALHRSYNLERLSLEDTIDTYRHQDVSLWSSIHLPYLKFLELKGSPALRFNMDSLHHSPYLMGLRISIPLRENIHDGSYYCIPPPEDLDREGLDDGELSGTPGTSSQGYPSIGKRPQWTWDWHLPRLSTLSLAAVFAYKFDFRWLQQLPNLQNIRLDTRSARGELHGRRIILEDLLRGNQKHELREQQQQQGEGHTLSDQYTSLPKLESIALDGHWTFGERVVETLCLVVSPNLCRVKLGRNCSGFTLQEWITLSRRMPLLKSLDLGLRMTSGKIKGLGLVPQSELQDEQHNKRTIEHRIGQSTFYDVLES